MGFFLLTIYVTEYPHYINSDLNLYLKFRQYKYLFFSIILIDKRNYLLFYKLHNDYNKWKSQNLACGANLILDVINELFNEITKIVSCIMLHFLKIENFASDNFSPPLATLLTTTEKLNQSHLLNTDDIFLSELEPLWCHYCQQITKL